MEKLTSRKIALHIVVALILSIGAWFVYETTNVPDDRLDIHMSVQADRMAEGTIWWNEQQKPYEDGWPLNLAALQFEDAQEAVIEIEPIVSGSVNTAALDNQVWLYDIATDVAPVIDWQNVQYGGDWVQEANDDMPSGYMAKTSSGAPSDTFVYTTTFQNWITFDFLRCEWCEGVKIIVNGQETILDLYRDPNNVEAEHRETYTTLPLLSLDYKGTLPLPLPEDANQFQLNFGNEITQLRIFGIDRSGSAEWSWQPGMSVQASLGTNIITTSEYLEAQSSPGNELALVFSDISTKTIHFGVSSFFFIFIVSLILFSLLTWWRILWSRIVLFSQWLYDTLSVQASPISLGKLTWIILAIALLIRVRYALEDPIWVLVGDSEQYIRKAFWIKHGFSYPLWADFFDLRTPGYPVFLSLSFWLFGTSYTSIIIAQMCLGLAAVYGGIRFGELLGSRWIGITLGIFLAITPDHLWFEHVVMTEVLSVTASIWCCVLGLQYLRNVTSFRLGILFALCSVVAVYNRPSVGLPFIGFWLLLVLIVNGLPLLKKSSQSLRSIVIWGSTVLIITVSVTPWIIRNGQTYGIYSLLAASERAQLIFWSWGGDLLDVTTPRMAQFRNEYEDALSSYHWGYDLGESRSEGEIIAEKLRDEQVAYNPEAYTQRAMYVTGNLLGRLPDGRVANEERFDVNFTSRTYTPGENTFEVGPETISFVPYGEYGITTQSLNWLWTNLFAPARFPTSLLSILTISIFTIWLAKKFFTANHNMTTSFDQHATLLLLGLGCVWLTTVAILITSLAYQPRYILPFDWIRIVLVAKIFEMCWQSIAQKGVYTLSEGLLPAKWRQ